MAERSRFSIRKCSVGTASFLIGTVAFSAFTTKLLQLKTQNSCPCDAITRELKQRIDRRKTDLQTNENETLQGGVSNNTLNREVEKENVNGIQEKPNAQKEEKHYLILNSHVLRNKTTQLRQLHRKRMITNFL